MTKPISIIDLTTLLWAFEGLVKEKTGEKTGSSITFKKDGSITITLHGERPLQTFTFKGVEEAYKFLDMQYKIYKDYEPNDKTK